MSRKTLLVQMALVLSLVLMSIGPSAKYQTNAEAAANSLTLQADCTDQAIKAAVIKGLKDKFPLNKRVITIKGKKQFRFNFLVSSSNKVVTLKGDVPDEKLRKGIIKQVQATLKGLKCGATLNPDVLDIAKKVFVLSIDTGHCALGEVTCPNGECKANRSLCDEAPFDND